MIVSHDDIVDSELGCQDSDLVIVIVNHGKIVDSVLGM